MNITIPRKVVDTIKQDEGYSREIYVDSLGYLTIGYGTYLGDGITKAEAEALLVAKLTEDIADFQRRSGLVLDLDNPRHAVLAMMVYQMGVSGVLKFRQTLLAFRAGQWDQAARNMLASKWAKQTPARAGRAANIMRTGEWLD